MLNKKKNCQGLFRTKSLEGRRGRNSWNKAMVLRGMYPPSYTCHIMYSNTSGNQNNRCVFCVSRFFGGAVLRGGGGLRFGEKYSLVSPSQIKPFTPHHLVIYAGSVLVYYNRYSTRTMASI